MDVTFVFESQLFEADSPPALEVADLLDTLQQLENLGAQFASTFPSSVQVSWPLSSLLTLIPEDDI